MVTRKDRPSKEEKEQMAKERSKLNRDTLLGAFQTRRVTGTFIAFTALITLSTGVWTYLDEREMTEEKVAVEEKYKDLKDTHTVLVADNEDLKEKFDKLNNDNDSLLSTNSSNSKQLTKAKLSLVKKNAKIDEYKKDLKLKEEEVAQLTKSKEEYEKKVASVQAELDSIKTNFDTYKNETDNEKQALQSQLSGGTTDNSTTETTEQEEQQEDTSTNTYEQEGTGTAGSGNAEETSEDTSNGTDTFTDGTSTNEEYPDEHSGE